MHEPPEGTVWRFVCSRCEGSRIHFENTDDEDGPVTCGLCGASLGTWGEFKEAMIANAEGEAPAPDAKIRFHEDDTGIGKTRH